METKSKLYKQAERAPHPKHSKWERKPVTCFSGFTGGRSGDARVRPTLYSAARLLLLFKLVGEVG